MFDILFSHIEHKVALSDAEKSAIAAFFSFKKIRKKQFILEEGEICMHLSFVNKGLIKSYRLDEKGNEHISLFGWEGWWISDFNSYINQQPATLYIDAVEDTELFLLTRAAYEQLTLDVPIMDRYFRLLYQNSLVTKDERLISSNSYSAEEKFQRLIQSNPEIMQRVPQHLVASYLGLAPETLSRIRKKLASTD
ncbi:Crp/Fnr family transcriptional regulator [Sphingobacterium faecium]|jgi:CRP-like cAMP-binding protein|uniref:Crp/Fnr family transcriptional regulator n=1 Tax=Sphingobacterium faecium TaxID=34087 RepID=UPI0004E6000A|nr:Crp/Fnr family transcriptional regulator [Sphingobacterium faecium]CDT20429.1 Cyclic nucleotide binding-regulatory protein [Sphingobacterium sp. PM2-P1-29]SJN49271.1 cAMP-binding proteins-catabolite gene activator and regulatory subunit of cAMP-dependent protein kinases [Sphingobacterium faecium PCAi_F2.5]HCU43876.1 Crp/Fnr family transcriptional regulator [Sphingobacterium sp.]UXD71311.1 Crp/Fnr family transcriptional regulator [Sphingobacterium faecium]WGQ14957.1 Crp/Fnr family transcript